MKPSIVLILVFISALAISKLAFNNWNLIFAGNLAMCVMLCFTAMGHFAFTRGMAMMMPGFMPYKIPLVYLTGIAEALLGIALLIPSARYYAGVVLLIFFILVLPANVSAAINQVDYQKATYTGPGVSYLWFRVPLQVLYIGWVYFFGVR